MAMIVVVPSGIAAVVVVCAITMRGVMPKTTAKSETNNKRRDIDENPCSSSFIFKIQFFFSKEKQRVFEIFCFG